MAIGMKMRGKGWDWNDGRMELDLCMTCTSPHEFAY